MDLKKRKLTLSEKLQSPWYLNYNFIIYLRERKEKIDDIKRNIRDAILVKYFIIILIKNSLSFYEF